MTSSRLNRRSFFGAIAAVLGSRRVPAIRSVRKGQIKSGVVTSDMIGEFTIPDAQITTVMKVGIGAPIIHVFRDHKRGKFQFKPPSVY